MAKKISMKPNSNVGKVNENNNENEMVEQGYNVLIAKGENVAATLGLMTSQIANDWIGIGAMAYGLTKVLAMLKVGARRVGMSIDSLHEDLMPYFEKNTTVILDEYEKEKGI